MGKSDYHLQVGATVPRLSYSLARTLIKKSPLHMYLEHPLLGGKGKVATKTMDIGTMVHALILDQIEEFVILDFDSYRTKDAQTSRDMAVEEGKIPLLAKDWEKVQEMAEAVKKQLAEQLPEFFEPGAVCEHEIVWTDDNGVECQSKLDKFNHSLGIIWDLKVTSDASPDKIQRKIFDMGYDIQESMYTTAVEKTYPDIAGRTYWKFIFIEDSEPYAIGIYQTEMFAKQVGKMKALRASRKFKKCLETGIWPGYGEQWIEAPSWEVRKEEEQYE